MIPFELRSSSLLDGRGLGCSYLSATLGSTRMARRDGKPEAAIAIVKNNSAHRSCGRIFATGERPLLPDREH